MEMILHHHHHHEPQAFGTLRLPSLFRHGADASERSPRLVGMSDVLNATRAASGDSPVARLPSIGSMIRRDDSARAAAADTSSPAASSAPAAASASTTDANSMSPAQKQSMDLYKQLREVPDARSHPEYALGSLLASAALSQLASMQEKKEAARTPVLPSSSSSVSGHCSGSESGSEAGGDKAKRGNSAKLCGMGECRKRAKAGGYCIAHGGGLRCSEEGCQKHAVSLGLCISHGGGKRCTIDGCLNASRKNGVCWSHGGKRLCKLEGCNKGPKSGGYCWSHGGKMKK